MGGVDLSDQNMKYYSVMHKSKKWWKKLFLHFFNLILTNSYTLYRKYGGERMKSQVFRQQISENWQKRTEMGDDFDNPKFSLVEPKYALK